MNTYLDNLQDGYWTYFLEETLSTPEMVRFQHLLAEKYDNSKVCPPKGETFRAFRETPYESIKVVILGEEPYPSAKHADGLAFSTKRSFNPPTSSINIKKELKRSFPEKDPDSFSGDLTNWAEQGVFLLNCRLTVENKKPSSHSSLGWEAFTNKTLQALNNHPEDLIFILLGDEAQTKKALITQNRHTILECGDPASSSLLSKPFIGSDCFLKTNYFLRIMGKSEISWLKDYK